MKKNIFLISCVISIIILILSNCPVEQPSTTTTYQKINRSNSFSGTSPEIFHINTNTYTELSYTLSNLNNNDVYYIFTNISTSSDKKNPVVYKNNNQIEENKSFSISKNRNIVSNSYIKDKEIVKEFNSNPEDFLNKHKSNSPIIEKRSNILPPHPRKATVGEQKTFFNLNYNGGWSIEYIPSTCRFSQNIKGKNLNIYVADDCWYIGGTKTYKVNDTMVAAMADKFLKADTTNDIYTLISGIYGSHWGLHNYPGFIPSSEEDNITILLYDIDNDNGNTTGGVVLGYFWAKDNYLNSELKKYTGLTEGGSNECTMFYIDACLFAKGDGLWDITDNYPIQMISTLAHELQHMIHFYQKVIKNNLSKSSDVWLDEMCSLMAEDFASEKIGFNGPRGIDYNDGTAGSPSNSNGRLPLYNNNNDDSVIVWLDGDDVLRSYSIVYSFGAYLARNFGGVKLFKNIVQNPYINYLAINNALSSLGYSETFSSCLQKWGAAVICSDQLTMSTGYSYNKGTWFTSTSDNTIDYNIGSINMFNYDPTPLIYENYQEVGYPYYSSLKKSSNRYYKRASGFSGTLKDLIRLEDTVRLTVVVK